MLYLYVYLNGILNFMTTFHYIGGSSKKPSFMNPKYYTHIRLEFNKGDVVWLMMVMSLGHDGYMHMKEISNLNHLCFNICFAYAIYKV